MRLTPKDPDYLASMGIYMFKRKALFDLLTEDTREDFGKHLIPTQVKKGNVAAYIHEGYWEDIGTVASFYEANIALTTSTPPFNCFDEKWRIFTNTTSLPGARVYNSKINCSILSEGSIIDTAEVNQSIIGPRTIIGKGSSIHSSYLLGNDIHYTEQKFYIGTNCVINRAIIDKQVTIGNNVQLVNKNKLFHYDGEIVYIRDGIIVVPSGTTIPDGFSI